MVTAQRDQVAGERHERVVHGGPVDPRDLVVLAVGVVVAALGAAQLVAVADHGHALADQQGGQEVAALAGAQRHDLGVVGLPLDTAVPRAVVRVAVVVVLAVGLVVLLVVGDEVTQREAVVGRDEVHGRAGAAPVPLVEVGRAGQAGGELAEGAGLAAPEVAYRVPVHAVPLGPEAGEVAHLVAAPAHVPRLGDELDGAQHRVLADHVEEPGEHVRALLPLHPGEGGGQVEPEAVHVHLGDPVAQGVHDQLEGLGAGEVHRVPGARVVHVVPLVALDEVVVAGVVQPAQAEHGALVVALGRVVVDHVEDHLETGGVQVLHHLLELADLAAHLRGGGVGGVRGEEAERVVAPVVAQPLLLQGGVVDELVHGHQLDGGHPELGQVADHLRVGHARVGAAQLLGDGGVQLGHALDVGLVDHRVRELDGGWGVIAPVEVLGDDDAEHARAQVVRGVDAVRLVEVVRVVLLAPLVVAGERPRVRVHEDLGRVVPQAAGGVPGAVHAVAVALPVPDARHVGVPCGAVPLLERDARLRAVVGDEAQLDRLHLAGDREGEVGAGLVHGGPEGVRLADLHCVHDSPGSRRAARRVRRASSGSLLARADTVPGRRSAQTSRAPRAAMSATARREAAAPPRTRRSREAGASAALTTNAVRISASSFENTSSQPSCQ